MSSNKRNRQRRLVIRRALNELRQRMSDSGATAYLGRLPNEHDCWKWAKSKGICGGRQCAEGLYAFGLSLFPEKPTRHQSQKKKQNKGDFYLSWEWKKARYETLKRWGATCMCCGAAERIVVDHIKPRSKFPELSLDLDNLQVLCNDCNMGKSNDDFTDWRPVDGLTVEERLDLELLESARAALH